MRNRRLVSLIVVSTLSASMLVGCDDTVSSTQDVEERVKVEEKVVDKVEEPALAEQVKKAKLPKSFEVEVNEEDKIVTVITHEKLNSSIKGDKHLHLVLYNIGTIGDKLKDVDYTKLQYINETEEGITTFKGLIAKEDIKDVFKHGSSPERTAACTSKIENLSIHQLVLNTMSNDIKVSIFF